MSAIHELQEVLQETETAQFVTTMLRDISATRLQSLRAIFEANRAYYSELHALTAMLRAYAAHVHVALPTTTFGTGRIYVAVTSNKRFYGQLNQQVITRLLEHLKRDTTATGLVIGQTGQQLLLRAPLAHPVSVMMFANETPTQAEVTSVIAALEPYTEVVVLHPTFINSFRQELIETDITHEPEVASEEVETIEYICEPDIQGMLAFFRTQIRFVLFERALLETRVALTGARLMKMQRARERAKELVATQRHGIHKTISTMQSMRLLETFTGFRSDRTL